MICRECFHFLRYKSCSHAVFFTQSNQCQTSGRSQDTLNDPCMSRLPECSLTPFFLCVWFDRPPCLRWPFNWRKAHVWSKSQHIWPPVSSAFLYVQDPAETVTAGNSRPSSLPLLPPASPGKVCEVPKLEWRRNQSVSLFISSHNHMIFQLIRIVLFSYTFRDLLQGLVDQIPTSWIDTSLFYSIIWTQAFSRLKFLVTKQICCLYYGPINDFSLESLHAVKTFFTGFSSIVQ